MESPFRLIHFRLFKMEKHIEMEMAAPRADPRPVKRDETIEKNEMDDIEKAVPFHSIHPS